MKNLTGISIILFGIIIFSLVSSCKHEPLGLNNFDTICFTRDVQPIFQNSCGKSGCHNGEEEGFDARTYESIMRSITPGNAKKSEAYKALTSVYINPMPPSPNPPLTKEQRTLIAIWINQGAMNTDCSGSSNTGNTDQTDSICFSQNILPLLQSSCAVAGCHDQTTHKEGLNLSSYSTLMSNSESIKPYNPSGSKVYKAMITTSGEDVMPPYPRTRLTSVQTEIFRKWIAQGALNSNCPSSTCDTSGTISFSTKVWPIIQNYCLGCHNTNAASGNINLNGYSNVTAVAGTMRSNISLLSGVINQKAGFIAMPPYGTKLDVCKIRTIELWIEQGKLNN
jgi:uncharacterized membrane protein